MKSYKNDFPMFGESPNLIYLDSGNTSQKPKQVIDTINDYYLTYNANIHRALYPIAEKATNAVEETRKKVAKFLHVEDPAEVIFTKNTTEGINLVAYSWGGTNLKRGDKIVSTIMEHHANFVPWQQLAKKKGADYVVWDIDEQGELIVQPIDRKTKLVAITQVSNMLGTINPVKKIIKQLKKENPKVFVLLDASQSAPHMPIDVQDLGCDFLVFTGHKIFAETGVGVLYGKRKLLESMPPFLTGGDMIREVGITETTFADLPNKFEAGTINIAGIISLGAAIDYIDSIGFEKLEVYEKELVEYTMMRLLGIPNLKLFGPRDLKKRAGIFSFSLDGIHPHDIGQLLGEKNICVRAGHHCTMPLHTRLEIPASTRVSVHIYNEKKDIDILVEEIKKIQRLFAKN